MHVLLFPLQVAQKALVESQASQLLLTIFPKSPPGQFATQLVPERNSNPVFPHLVHRLASLTSHATQSVLQSPQISPTGSFPSSQTATQELP